MRKEPQTKGYSTNSSTLRQCQGHEKQGKTELSQIGGHQTDVKSQCNLGSWTRIRTLSGTTSEIRVKSIN